MHTQPPSLPFLPLNITTPLKDHPSIIKLNN
eukprot:UN06169